MRRKSNFSTKNFWTGDAYMVNDNQGIFIYLTIFDTIMINY
jgi:hypothetical protein